MSLVVKGHFQRTLQPRLALQEVKRDKIDLRGHVQLFGGGEPNSREGGSTRVATNCLSGPVLLGSEHQSKTPSLTIQKADQKYKTHCW